MVYFMEHSIKAIHEKEQAAAGGGGGTSPEDQGADHQARGRARGSVRRH